MRLAASRVGKIGATGVAIVSSLLIAYRVSAQSQPWLEDRQFGEGIGIRSGDFELHPGVAAEVGIDSNFFQGSGRNTAEGVQVPIAVQFQPTFDGNPYGQRGTFHEPKTGAYRLRLTPSLTLESRGEQRDGERNPGRLVDLKASLSASYNELLPTDDTYAEELSHRRFVSADAGVEANFLPEQQWGMRLDGNFSRAVQPANDPLAAPGFDRSTVRGGSAVEWRPGGDLLRWKLGYQFTYVHFEDRGFSALSNLKHGVHLGGQWKFLPRTSLFYKGSYSYLTYPNAGVAKVAGAPLSSRIGLNGLMTDHFGVLVSVGWKSLFFAAQDEFDGVVGELLLSWYPQPQPDKEMQQEQAPVGLSSIKLGYRRDATPAYLGNFVQTDTVQAKGAYFVGGAVLLSVDLNLQRRSRPESFFSPRVRQSLAFAETRANASGFVEYRTSDSFGVNATLRYSAALTKRVIPLSSATQESLIGYDEISFSRVEAWLGVRWFL